MTDVQAMLDFIHARLDSDEKEADTLPGEEPNYGHRVVNSLRKLVESRPGVDNPAAFEDVERQREWTWKCIAAIWSNHEAYREEWRP